MHFEKHCVGFLTIDTIQMVSQGSFLMTKSVGNLHTYIFYFFTFTFISLLAFLISKGTFIKCLFFLCKEFLNYINIHYFTLNFHYCFMIKTYFIAYMLTKYIVLLIILGPMMNFKPKNNKYARSIILFT